MKIKNSYYYAEDFDIQGGRQPKEFIRSLLKRAHREAQEHRKLLYFRDRSGEVAIWKTINDRYSAMRERRRKSKAYSKTKKYSLFDLLRGK